MSKHESTAYGCTAVLCVLLAGCTITTRVDPVSPVDLRGVCIKENTAVWSKEFLPALRAEFEHHGIRTTVYNADKPTDCVYHVEYEANWYWDVAVYLQYCDIRVYEGTTRVGRATYDARGGGARLDKFGTTVEKLHRLTTELLRGTNAGTGAERRTDGLGHLRRLARRL